MDEDALVATADARVPAVAAAVWLGADLAAALWLGFQGQRPAAAAVLLATLLVVAWAWPMLRADLRIRRVQFVGPSGAVLWSAPSLPALPARWISARRFGPYALLGFAVDEGDAGGEARASTGGVRSVRVVVSGEQAASGAMRRWHTRRAPT
jgi:hypothetical protein